MAFSGQNIKFLTGSYDALSKMTTSQAGAFYVTNDTHEMFLGIDANKAPVSLNRWVDVKDNWAAIQAVEDYKQHPGKIYYAQDENILCTYNGTTWVQINPDTDTDTKLTSVNISDGVVTGEEGNKSIEYTLTFNQSDIDGKDLADPITATLKIDSDLVTSLVVEVQVGLEASVTDGKATVKTIGAGSDASKTVVVTGADGVTIVDTDEGFEINGTTYDLLRGVAGNSVVLKDSDNGEKEVKLVGDNWIETKAGTANNEIAIAHKAAVETGATNVKTTNAAGVSVNAETRKFSAVTNVKADANGHVVSAELTEFEIPNSIYDLQAVESHVDPDNETSATFTTAVNLVDGQNSVKGTAAVKTAHTITIDGVEKVVANGGDLGSFYSASNIDTKLKAVDAMVYKGIVASELALPTSNVQIGHTYKASEDFSLSQGGTSISIKKGDLLIANGAEGTPDANGNAYITGTITWDHIESGTDADTTYDLIGADNKIILKDKVTNAETDFIAVTDDDTYITATVSGDTLHIVHNTITVDGDTTGEEQKPTFGGSVDVITGVSRDGAGHVTGVETTKVILPGADKVALDATAPSFELTDADDTTKGKIVFADSEKIEVTGEVANNVLTVTASHKEIEGIKDNGTATEDYAASLDGSASFDVLKEVEYDKYGHITGFKTGTVTIEEETTYILKEAVVADNTVTYVLEDNDENSAGSIVLASDSLQYTLNEDKSVQVELVWGTF